MRAAIYTLGCKVNQYETQAMETILRQKGFELVDFEQPAEVYIINTCTVTAVSDKKSRQVIRRARRNSPSAVVAVCGCFGQTGGQAARELGADLVSGTGDRLAFLDRLEERTLHQEPESEYLSGSRRLCAEDISFAEDIIQNDNLLEFYMEVSFNADEVFGTNVCTTENDDWLNIYANYDLERGCVCDTLEVFLQCSNGDELDFKYRLSPEEQALFIPKMNTYCQEHWGQSLEECCTDYLAEQSPASPEMQM